MCIVRIGVQQGHGDRVDAQLFQFTGHALDLFSREGLQRAALRVQPLMHFNTAVGSDQWLRQHDVKVIDVIAPFAADVEHVAHAFGGDQGSACPLPLDQCVGDQGRAMDNFCQRGCVHAHRP